MEDIDLDSFDLIRGIFSFATEHWVNVQIKDRTIRVKYIPLSLREKINIYNKYEHIEDEDDKATAMTKEQCLVMLRKANEPNDFKFFEELPQGVILSIYKNILQDMTKKRLTVEKYCSDMKTIALKPSKMKEHVLDPIVNMTIIAKDTSLNLEDIVDLDELSLSCLLVGVNEIAVRESNSYETAQNK